MCSINGFNFKDREAVLRMNEATQHRGPDGTGYFEDEHVSLGHNLLAIIETAENSLQPIVSLDRTYALVYNGEIYNYKILRRELSARGEKFRTDCDTEVLFRGLIKYGADYLEKLDGMFALGFYDKRKGTILLARDSAGIKPLYYYHQDQKFIFSSEKRGIFTHALARRKLDGEMLSIFFSLGYVPGPRTLISNLRKICPGQYLIYDLHRHHLASQWFGHKNRSDAKASFEPASFRKMIGRSVVDHTMGLRPFGLYLSGGLDSTVILHELARASNDLVHTYTTRFDTKDKNINEDADLAQKLCHDYHIEHHELLVRENDFIGAIEKTMQTVEEPRYNFNLPAYWLLSQHASKDLVVVLLGSGGDELFLGYPRYRESQNISRRFQKYPNVLVNLWYYARALKYGHGLPRRFVKLHRPLDRWVYYFSSISRIAAGESRQVCRFSPLPAHQILFNYLSTINNPIIASPLPDMESAMGEFDRITWLADEDFLRTDKITMHFGLEGRFPFLAKDIVHFANGLSSEEKLKNRQTKSLVRRAYKEHLPDYIINKKKSGWYAPAVEWMHSDFGKFVREVLSDGYYPDTASLFDLDFIRQKYVDSVSQFTQSNIKKFMPIFFFQVWARELGVKM